MRRLLLLSVLIGTAHSWNAFAPIARRVPVARSGSRARVARGSGLRGPLLQRAVDVERAEAVVADATEAPGAARDAAGARAAAGAPGVTFAECLRFALPALGIYVAGPLMSLIDAAFVGRSAGPASLVALGPACALPQSRWLVGRRLVKFRAGRSSGQHIDVGVVAHRIRLRSRRPRWLVGRGVHVGAPDPPL